MTGERWCYTLAMLLATVVAGWMLRSSQRRLQIDPRKRVMILGAAFLGGTLGAKLPFVLGAASLGFESWLGDGKTILWGLVGGYLGVEAAKWALGERVRTGDTFIIPIATAIAIGRIGCLCYGCCYGTPTQLPWGLTFITAEDGGTVARHPTQIYEFVFHLSCAVLAAIGIRRRWFIGNWMPLYIACYAVFRFVSEWLRPEAPVVWGLTFYQLSSLPIAVGMIVLVYLRDAPMQGTAPSQEASPHEMSQRSEGTL